MRRRIFAFKVHYIRILSHGYSFISDLLPLSLHDFRSIGTLKKKHVRKIPLVFRRRRKRASSRYRRHIRGVLRLRSNQGIASLPKYRIRAFMGNFFSLHGFVHNIRRSSDRKKSIQKKYRKRAENYNVCKHCGSLHNKLHAFRRFNNSAVFRVFAYDSACVFLRVVYGNAAADRLHNRNHKHSVRSAQLGFGKSIKKERPFSDVLFLSA